MSFEFGFVDVKDKNNKNYDQINNYWYWCGWDNTNLFKLLSNLGLTETMDEDNQCEIRVKDLAFIETLYEQLKENEIFDIIHKLYAIDDVFVNRFLEELPILEVAKFHAAFYIEGVNHTVHVICGALCERTLDGYAIVESLYEAYQKMKVDGVETVWMYCSY